MGRIDRILVTGDGTGLQWSAVEVQAVYFSGEKMEHLFVQMSQSEGGMLPWPDRIRRPDDRSSGPKRLMPQLQIKVPTLRRWGKKMAVVVDEGFFDALGKMEDAGHVSNADLAWFVCRFRPGGNGIVLEPAFVKFTTLEHAVVGLTAGAPVTLAEFEEHIVKKLRLSG